MSGNLFGWTDDIWHVIDQTATLLGLMTGTTGFLGLIVAIFKRESLRHWLSRNHFPNVGSYLAEDDRWDGLIFTVSRAELPIQVIKQLRPQHVGFIATKQSLVHAEKIMAERFDWNLKTHGILLVENPDDPAESREMTHLLLNRMQAAGTNDCAVDVTGGKLPMSLGAFMAAEEAEVSTLYMASRYDETLKKPDSKTSRIHRISRPG